MSTTPDNTITATPTAASTANTPTSSSSNNNNSTANNTSSNNNNHFEDHFPEESFEDHSENHDDSGLTLRALVSTKEAGVIIGKGGKNVAEMRDTTGVKAGVSKVVQGVHDRVLTVSGTLEGVSKAYSLIAQTLLDNPISPLPTTTSSTTSSITNNNSNAVATIRLLISHNLMGTVIGRQGAKIKHIQDTSGVRMIASKTLLPQSTERVVEVRGTVDAIHKAILEIGRCLIEDKERAYGTILYNPTKVNTNINGLNDHRIQQQQQQQQNVIRTGNGSDFSSHDFERQQQHQQQQQAFLNDPNVRTQNISIPSDMVGCIIGKGGSKISEIRRLSGSRISIAKVPHDESGERMFTIQGTPEANERALYLLYGQLENEKERRLRGVMTDDTIPEEH
ncbi:cytoplasm protein [Mucor lusitanicus]|uniref:Cytoplasm protein n=2 Tax=Mucor circinelloides f. lusitanicus TaxID=29924 RepID=A0A8H4BPT7_MUCCL|nr:cytoplasm protein [Mucor lusitanicus]